MPIHKNIRLRPITPLIGVLFLLLSITGLSADSPRVAESSAASSLLVSDYSPVADDDVGDVIGSFVVRVPQWNVWAGGRRVVRRTRTELGALPLRDWFTDYVMHDESIGARGQARAKRVVWDLARSALDEGVLAATDELRRQHFVQSINVDFDAGLGGRFANLAINALGPLHESEDAALAWQLRSYAGEDSRRGGNIGAVYRWAAEDEWLLGLNSFIDYQSDDGDNFLRWSVGVESRSAWTDVFANYYDGISDDIIRRRADGVRESLWTASGYDIEVNIHAPSQQWLTGVLGWYSWRGKYGRDDVDGVRVGLKIKQQEFPLVWELSYDNADDGKKIGGRLSYYHRFGETAGGGAAFSSSFRPRDWFYAPVEREHTQRIFREEDGVAVAVTGVIRSFRVRAVNTSGADIALPADTTVTLLGAPGGESVTLRYDPSASSPGERDVLALLNADGAVTLSKRNPTGVTIIVEMGYESGETEALLAVRSTVVLDGLSVRLVQGEVNLRLSAGAFTVFAPERVSVVVGRIAGADDSTAAELTYVYVANNAGNVLTNSIAVSNGDFDVNVGDDTKDLNFLCPAGETRAETVVDGRITIGGACLRNFVRDDLKLNLAVNSTLDGGGTRANPWVVPREPTNNLRARSGGAGIVLATAEGVRDGVSGGYRYSGDGGGTLAVDATSGEISFAQDVSANQREARYTMTVSVAVNNTETAQTVVFRVPAAPLTAVPQSDVVSRDNLAVGTAVATVVASGGVPSYSYRGADTAVLAVNNAGVIRFIADVSGETAATSYIIAVTVTDRGGSPAVTVTATVSVAGVVVLPTGELTFSDGISGRVVASESASRIAAGAPGTANNPWNYVRDYRAPPSLPAGNDNLGTLSVTDTPVGDCTFTAASPFSVNNANGIVTGVQPTSNSANNLRLFGATCTGRSVADLSFYYDVIQRISLTFSSEQNFPVTTLETNAAGGLYRADITRGFGDFNLDAGEVILLDLNFVGGTGGHTYTDTSADGLDVGGVGAVEFSETRVAMTATTYTLTVTIDDDSGAAAYTATIGVSVPGVALNGSFELLLPAADTGGDGTSDGTAYTFVGTNANKGGNIARAVGSGGDPNAGAYTYEKVGTDGPLVVNETTGIVRFAGSAADVANERHTITVAVRDKSPTGSNIVLFVNVTPPPVPSVHSSPATGAGTAASPYQFTGFTDGQEVVLLNTEGDSLSSGGGNGIDLENVEYSDDGGTTFAGRLRLPLAIDASQGFEFVLAGDCDDAVSADTNCRVVPHANSPFEEGLYRISIVIRGGANPGRFAFHVTVTDPATFVAPIFTGVNGAGLEDGDGPYRLPQTDSVLHLVLPQSSQTRNRPANGEFPNIVLRVEYRAHAGADFEPQARLADGRFQFVASNRCSSSPGEADCSFMRNPTQELLVGFYRVIMRNTQNTGNPVLREAFFMIGTPTTPTDPTDPTTPPATPVFESAVGKVAASFRFDAARNVFGVFGDGGEADPFRIQRSDTPAAVSELTADADGGNGLGPSHRVEINLLGTGGGRNTDTNPPFVIERVQFRADDSGSFADSANVFVLSDNCTDFPDTGTPCSVILDPAENLQTGNYLVIASIPDGSERLTLGIYITVFVTPTNGFVSFSYPGEGTSTRPYQFPLSSGVQSGIMTGVNLSSENGYRVIEAVRDGVLLDPAAFGFRLRTECVDTSDTLCSVVRADDDVVAGTYRIKIAEVLPDGTSNTDAVTEIYIAAYSARPSQPPPPTPLVTRLTLFSIPEASGDGADAGNRYTFDNRPANQAADIAGVFAFGGNGAITYEKQGGGDLVVNSNTGIISFKDGVAPVGQHNIVVLVREAGNGPGAIPDAVELFVEVTEVPTGPNPLTPVPVVNRGGDGSESNPFIIQEFDSIRFTGSAGKGTYTINNENTGYPMDDGPDPSGSSIGRNSNCVDLTSDICDITIVILPRAGDFQIGINYAAQSDTTPASAFILFYIRLE